VEGKAKTEEKLQQKTGPWTPSMRLRGNPKTRMVFQQVRMNHGTRIVLNALDLTKTMHNGLS
jgi:hypothetical protein